MVKEVDVEFTLADNESDPVTITQFYSNAGPFLPMTLVTGDIEHTLPSNPVTSSPGGITYNSVWDARTDLGNGFTGTVTVRTTADDGINTPVNFDTTVGLVNNTNPAGSIDSIVQRANDTNLTDIQFTGIDSEGDPITVVTEFSTVGFGGPFSAMTLVPGDGAHTFVTPFPATPGGEARNIVWDPKTDLPPGFYANVYFRFTIDDGASGPLEIFDSQIIYHNTAPIVTGASAVLRP